MPELPEVETTVRGLRKRVVGQTITDFWCDHAKMVRYIAPEELAEKVVGGRIVGIRRRGKNIIMDLSNKLSVVIHMKMTGHLIYAKFKRQNSKGKIIWQATEPGPIRDDPYNRFVHAVFTLDNRKDLAFSDMRKFGRIALHQTKNLHTAKELMALGPELWEIDAKKFREWLLVRPKGRIKQVLMNQEVLAGVGNIYSDEGLWVAGIHPLSKPGKIPNDKLLKLFRALVRVTKMSLKTGGDSMSDYRNVDGLGGRFQNFHRAYKRTGQACRKKGCAGRVKRIVVGARSAHYCPAHQKRYV